MFKKQLVKNANVKILVANYRTNPANMDDSGWMSSGAVHHIEQATVGTIPSISVAKKDNDELGLDRGGRGGFRIGIFTMMNSLSGFVFLLPKLTTPEQINDARDTLGHLDTYSQQLFLKPLLILMENNPSDSELQRSDKKAEIASYLGNWMVTNVEYVDSLENKEEIEKNLVWLQEQVMNQILNPVETHWSKVKKIKTGDDKPTTQKIFGKKSKSVEKTIAKEEKMVAKKEKKQTGILGWIFD